MIINKRWVDAGRKGCCFVGFLLVIAFFTSCGKDTEVAKQDEIRLAYSGDTCDLPLITSVQNGYFKEEGLNVTLVRLEKGDLGKSIQEGIVDGGTADAGILTDIYNGLPVKIGVGVRGACLEILALTESDIKEPGNLKGKKVGVRLDGTAETAAALEVLEQYDVDGIEAVDWSYLEEDELLAALREKRIDALVCWQGSSTEASEEISIIYENNSYAMGSGGGHSHGTKEHFYESFAVLSDELIQKDQEKASVLLTAWIKGVNTLADNEELQIEQAKEEGYITEEFQDEELASYMFAPGVKTVPTNLETFARLFKSRGLLGKEIETEDFIDSVFAELLPEW